jgi:hypothetical protein
MTSNESFCLRDSRPFLLSSFVVSRCLTDTAKQRSRSNIQDPNRNHFFGSRAGGLREAPAWFFTVFISEHSQHFLNLVAYGE